MHSSLTMRSFVVIVNVVHILLLILVLISSSLIISIHAESNADTEHSDDTVLESKETNLCDYNGGPKALGMESGEIADHQITTSSAYNFQSVGPQSARLKKDKSGGAWCPHTQLSAESAGKEWIQIDLTDRHVITGVSTQGRYGGGYGVEYVEEYWIEYSRDNGSNWIRWKGPDGNHLLEGNVDTNSVVEHDLEIPIVGVKHIRLFPYSKHLRTVCLRFELYGCLHRGPISYSMPNGVKGSRFGDLMDITYDGLISDSGYLSAGLGQLVDGIKGLDNYKINKAFEWIGWQNTNQTIEIVFDFETVRNFTTANINCHNNFNREVRVFSSAFIWFSIDGIKWSKVPIKYTYQSDNTLERPRDVIIHLQYRIGRFIKMSFKLGAKWLHISEIIFDSESTVNTSANLTHLFDFDQTFDSISDFNSNNSLSPMATKDSDQMTMKYSLIIITLVTLGVVVLMVISSFVMRAYNNRKGNVFREISNTDIESESAAVNMKDIPKITTPQTLLYCEPKDLSPNDDEAEYAVPDVICANNGKSKSLQMPSKGIKTNPRYYASSEIIKSKHNLNDSNNKYGKQVLNHYESANYSSQQTPLLSTFMTNQTTHNQSHHQRNGSLDFQQIKRFNETDIFVFDKMGNSKFGDVWFAKIAAKPQQNQENKDIVLVKTLIHVQLKQEFLEEMKFFCQLSKNCDKFAKTFGVLDTSDYFGLILEYGDCDLNQFLRECDPSVITCSTLIYFASEVASGLKYLETLGVVHKDIAARNILVYTDDLIVKISDSGSYSTLYKNDYLNGIAIRWTSPEALLHGIFSNKSDVYSFGVMFWEILTYCSLKPFHNLDDQSFLKAFVSIHEQTANIDCDNKDNYYHQYTDGTDQRAVMALPRPDGCPKEIYDLMLDCWQTNDVSRPTFREISLFLSRKTIGFQKPQL